MGSWSESCGFSGIEIGEQEAAYVAFLGKPKHRDFGGETHFELRTPLIRGTYDDYGYLNVADDEGVLALFNKLSGLELKNGDDFADRDVHFVAELDRFWIREDVHKSLDGLTQEFPYYGRHGGKYENLKVKNIGEAVSLHMEDVRRAAEQDISDRAKWVEVSAKLSEMTEEEKSEFVLTIAGRRLCDVMGYRTGGVDWRGLFQTPPEGVNLDALIEAYRRSHTLTFAASELRKKLAPSEQGGPQHNGEVASCQFARAILKIQKERKKRWDN